jgi:hypothetical protein
MASAFRKAQEYKEMWESLYRAFPKKEIEIEIENENENKQVSVNDFKVGDNVEWNEETYHNTFYPEKDTDTENIKWNRERLKGKKRIGKVSRVSNSSITIEIWNSFSNRNEYQKIHYKKIFCVKKL